MQIKLTAFGIAKDILGTRELELELEDDLRIIDLKELLINDYPAFRKLQSLSFAVDESYQKDDFRLSAGNNVVIIPPVSGG